MKHPLPLLLLSLVLGSLGCSRPKEGETTTTSASSTVASAAPAAGSIAKPKAAQPTVVETGGGVVRSCVTKDTPMCAEYSNLTFKELSEAQESCSDVGEKFGPTPCSRKNVLGVCRHKADKVTMYIYKGSLVATVKDAKELCDDGEFTPGPVK